MQSPPAASAVCITIEAARKRNNILVISVERKTEEEGEGEEEVSFIEPCLKGGSARAVLLKVGVGRRAWL